VAGYLCTPRTGAHVGALTAGLRLPGGEYRLTLLRPADLQVVETRRLRSPGLREQVPVELPAFTDDLAIQIECLRRDTRTPIPGTG